MKAIETINSPWQESFYELLGSARRSVLLVSPFIKYGQTKRLLNCFDAAGVSSSIQLDVVTDMNPDNILSGSLDIAALLQFTDYTKNLTITYVPNLHAKVYVVDRNKAIITSANLTGGGLARNLEYGVLIRDPSTVAQVCSDMNRYAALGSSVSRQSLNSLSDITADLKSLREKADRSIRQEFRKAFNERLEAVKFELMSLRAEGKTTHAIFANTILYLLETKPFRTVDMHPLIQQIHPDLCNDNEDRIIKGVHFGKKWKHFVRTAQVHLKRKGLIRFDGTYWRKTQ